MQTTNHVGAIFARPCEIPTLTLNTVTKALEKVEKAEPTCPEPSFGDFCSALLLFGCLGAVVHSAYQVGVLHERVEELKLKQQGKTRRDWIDE